MAMRHRLGGTPTYGFKAFITETGTSQTLHWSEQNPHVMKGI